MSRARAIIPAARAAPSPKAAGRRLGAALLLSLLVHGMILSLHFGVPGMALQGTRSAINITLAKVQPPAPEPELEPVQIEALPPARAQAAAGMRLVDPVVTAAPARVKRPAPVRKPKRRKAARVSSPLALPQPEPAVRVIAQASNPASDFVVPLPQPDEAEQKTIDPADAQHGNDDADVLAQEQVPAAEPDPPEVAATVVDDRQAQLEAQQKAGSERLAEQRMAEELLAQQRQAQEAMERQEAEIAALRRANDLLERQKSEQLLAQQRSAQLALQQQEAEKLLAQQRRDLELAERKKGEEQLARQRLAEEMAARKRVEELAAQRAAEQGAREQAARERERERELAQARAEPAGDPFGSPQGQGGGGARPAAVNHGSDIANRIRDLSKGLDLLTGAPPARPRDNDDRQSRRVVADRAERDVPLRMYVESWRQKIERNGSMNFPKLMAERARIDPLVSVAVRSDGSIEDVTIVRSSGRADTDEAVRRIVRINALYSKFPPNVAARYDVIEIRRVWTFDQVLKLIEEVR